MATSVIKNVGGQIAALNSKASHYNYLSYIINTNDASDFNDYAKKVASYYHLNAGVDSRGVVIGSAEWRSRTSSLVIYFRFSATTYHTIIFNELDKTNPYIVDVVNNSSPIVKIITTS